TGYHIAHVFHRASDPIFNTAGWNLAAVPGFLKLFTEEQDKIDLLHDVLQQAAFNLYFKDLTLGIDVPVSVSDRGIDLCKLCPGWTPRLYANSVVNLRSSLLQRGLLREPTPVLQ